MPKHLKNWKYVVMDEAHTYSGSKGIEISMLIRRLSGYAASKPRFILTSATLGQKNRSENDIVAFAHNLTSAEFTTDDIIFSTRIPFPEQLIQYQVEGSDYAAIMSEPDDLEKVRAICNKYDDITEETTRACIFELLKKDKNVHFIYALLRSKSKSFRYLAKKFSGIIAAKELLALIEAINYANKDGVELFDLKYHSFVRPLSGAYITLDTDQQLSLTKTDKIGKNRAFEIGNCRYCGTPFVIGRILPDEENGIDHLYQNAEVDIYENYGENKNVYLDYFLLENSIVDDDDVKEDVSLEEYKVCVQCGAIRLSGSTEKACDCDAQEATLYRVVENRKFDNSIDARNNLRCCPCCGHHSREAGVVRALNLGKDEGTALIGQSLFEAIGDNTAADRTHQTGRKIRLSADPLADRQSVSQMPQVKQFLSFSDSRQQASFAPVFFNSIYVRQLQKRLIWKVIEECNYQDVSIDELAARLTEKIKRNNLFDNKLSPQKHAWLAIMTDLLRAQGTLDGERLGLFYFELDISDLEQELDEEMVDEVFGGYGIDKQDLLTIMQVIMQSFRSQSAINYVVSTLTNKEKSDNLGYAAYDNHIMYKCEKLKKHIKSLMPAGSREENSITRYVKKVCGCDDNGAEMVIKNIFFQLALADINDANPLLKKLPDEEAFQVNVSRYKVKNYKTSRFYMCDHCGRITPFNVHNKCVADKCNGILHEIDPDIELANNYYRNEYKTRQIERIVIEEHTAQLDKKTARQYQKEFKEKKINILSCSTTFEMGIDLGDLDTVFMRNVPPTPANYVQRAGRAGRRKNSTAYVLTYCDAKSHDYTYFENPQEMISGVIEPPHFNVMNEKIIERHLMASCLGSFFRRDPSYFKYFDTFVFEGGVEAFDKYVLSRPEDLVNYLDRKVLPEKKFEKYHDMRWFEAMGGDDEKLRYMTDSVNSEARDFKEAMQTARDNENYSDAEYFKRQISSLNRSNTLDMLSRYCVIPKYGFPVDVVDLQVYERGVPDRKYDLSRDLKIAISEYAPDSEVVVNGEKVISRYISLPRNGQLKKVFFMECPNCRKMNLSVSPSMARCKYCGAELEPMGEPEFFVEPSCGFKTGVVTSSTWMKPKRSYAGQVKYIGEGEPDELHLDIKGVIAAESSSNDKLLVMNNKTFYMCPTCGYSEVGSYKGKKISREHKNYRQFDCDNDKLERIHIGHIFRTDVVKIKINICFGELGEDLNVALSFMYALLEGVSMALDIERNDINGLVEPDIGSSGYDVLLYDNVPGGAGHVKRLMNEDSMIKSLEAALKKVSQNCCDEDTSCYNCLRNYRNQSVHNRLKRRYAKELISMLLRSVK